MRSTRISLILILLCGAAALDCTVCRDRSAVTFPDTIVSFSGYPDISCGALDMVIPQMLPDEASEQCTMVRQLSSLCGCPRIVNGCTLCPDGRDVPLPNAMLAAYADLFGGELVPKCSMVEAYLHSMSDDTELCIASRKGCASKCGCPVLSTAANVSITDVSITDVIISSDVTALTGSNIIDGAPFFGSQNRGQLSTQYRVSRSAAILSLLGSLLVLQDCLRTKKRRGNLYNQIMMGMAIFDIIYSISLALGTIPMPSDDLLTAPGEMGNDLTCTLQGVFMELGGMSSLFFNVALSTYYILVIVHGTRQMALNRLRKWILGLPVLGGIIMGCASIPFIETGVVGCQVMPPLDFLPTEVLEAAGFESQESPFLGLLIIPGYLVIAFTTGALFRVYFHIRKVDKKARKWKFRQNTKSTDGTSTTSSNNRQKSSRSALSHMRAEVFWQSVLYLVALYLTWFVYLSVTVHAERYITSHYALWTFLFFIAPLQGFLNSLCYFRPRLSRHWRKWRKSHRGKKKRASQDSANSEATKEIGEIIGEVEPAADLVRENEQAPEAGPQGDAVALASSHTSSSSIYFGSSDLDRRSESLDTPLSVMAEVDESFKGSITNGSLSNSGVFG